MAGYKITLCLISAMIATGPLFFWLGCKFWDWWLRRRIKLLTPTYEELAELAATCELPPELIDAQEEKPW